MSEISSVNPSDSASNIHSASLRSDSKVMEAVKEGLSTSRRHGPQGVDVLSQISSAIADECLSSSMSVIEPALALLETRGVHALHGPTLFVEYWTGAEETDDTAIDTEHFEYKADARYNQFGQIARWEKIACALLNATVRVCQQSGGQKFAGHLGLIGPPLDLDSDRVDRMLWCARRLHHTVVPYCVVTNFWAVCCGAEPRAGYGDMLAALTAIFMADHRNLIRLAKAGEGVNSIVVRRLTLNRNRLTTVVLYLLCTSYAPSDEALNLYTTVNWRLDRRVSTLNRLWKVMNDTEPPTRMFDGANYTEITPIGRVRERNCVEGALPENPAAEQEEGEDGGPEEAEDDRTPEPEFDQDEEMRYLGADDPTDKGPSAARYVAPTRDLPKTVYKKCRVYCDLPAEAMYCNNDRETKSAKVGGRMIATLTENVV
ncbi:unnamed protein product [Haemonchus placei]|uniref:ORF50 n=1 Tax=Haemonchus placei TaxID=6290 RepID=A0A0N4WMJ7_HAEPC|nr:unnamed protein product [Haemonchus placei]